MGHPEYSHTVAQEIDALRLIESVDATVNGVQIVFVDTLGVQRHFRGSFALHQAATPAHKPTLILFEGQPENAVSISDLIVKGAC